MFPFSLVLVVVGLAWIVVGVRLALNSRGVAERAAARNRAYRDPVPIMGIAHRSTTYRPRSTVGMRRAGGVFVLTGTMFLIFSALLASTKL